LEHPIFFTPLEEFAKENIRYQFPKEDEVTLRRAIETSNPKIRWLPIWWSCGMPRLSDYIRLKKMIDEIGIS
jgi:hypothetical protein